MSDNKKPTDNKSQGIVDRVSLGTTEKIRKRTNEYKEIGRQQYWDEQKRKDELQNMDVEARISGQFKEVSTGKKITLVVVGVVVLALIILSFIPIG